MHTIVETHEFLRRAIQCGISDESRFAIIDFVAKNPMAGDLIHGTGGARKIRFARSGHGKSSGYRIITFYSGVDMPVFLLTMFAKNEKSNVSDSEKNDLKKILKNIQNTYRRP